jgi:hypothetical protein
LLRRTSQRHDPFAAFTELSHVEEADQHLSPARGKDFPYIATARPAIKFGASRAHPAILTTRVFKLLRLEAHERQCRTIAEIAGGQCLSHVI